MRKLAKWILTGWGVMVISILSLVIGLITADGGDWGGLAFGVFFLWFVLWGVLMQGGWFKIGR